MIGLGSFTGSGNILNSFLSRSTNTLTSALGCPFLRSLGLNFANIKKLFSKNEDEVNVSLKDMSLQTSTYNKIIPDIFGEVRLAGNIIWCTPIMTTDIHHQQKITKNGTQNAYTETLVRSSFAIAICKGKVDKIKNIYADDEPLNLLGYNIKIYYGDNEQEENSLMKNYLKTDIPAFRGLCYAVFTDFPMEQFNNRIPNFTFDVVRQSDITDGSDIENMVTAITIIPGCGEFVYDTITQKRLNGGYIMGHFFETSKATILNNHTQTAQTNALDSLDDLLKTFPKLEWVSIVVYWFCDNLWCDNASVYPACEDNSIVTSPDTWSVNGLKRTHARVIGKDNGIKRYGGTPSDASLQRYVSALKNRGLKVCITPTLMMDIKNKPWRGDLTGSANGVFSFLKNKYANFVQHYINLLKGSLDAFIIGSELKGLTNVRNENGKYPAVQALCDIANSVKNQLGKKVIVSYGANWNEYHSNKYGDYNLDDLWSCNGIDVIGIDAYFPLTNIVSSTYNMDKIIKSWRSGEGYDFLYIDTTKTQKEQLSPEYAWKNIEYFWSNEHYNKNGNKTSWIPKSKKIWFTGYGFPSVDCCTNEPSIFLTERGNDAGKPIHSQGVVDFMAQRVAISATERAWSNSDCVENKFLYAWDARPYPYYPNLRDFWSDCDIWKYSHCINGKVSYSKLTNIVQYLCHKLSLSDDEFDVSNLNDIKMQGYVIDDKNSVLKHLQILAEAYAFDAYLDDGKICFKSLCNADTHIISEDDLIIDIQTNKPFFSVNSVSHTTIPSSVELLFQDIDNDYKLSTAIASDNSRNTQSYSVSIGVPMNLSQAQEIAWRILSNISTQNTEYKLRIPITYMNIMPLDVISIKVADEKHLIRVKSVNFVDTTMLEIFGISTIANDNILTDLEYSYEKTTQQTISTSAIPETKYELFELHNIKNDIANDSFVLHCAIWSNDDNWDGVSVYYSTDEEQNYEFLSHVGKESCVGQLISISSNDTDFLTNNPLNKDKNNISSCFVDEQNVIEIFLTNEYGKLQTISDEKFSQLKNLILVGKEVIAFRDVEQISETRFKLKHLLRGRFNTENEILNHKIGERVILLDEDIKTIELPITQKDKKIYIKAISLNEGINKVASVNLTANALSACDFNTQNLDIKTMINGDMRLSFSSCKSYKVQSSGGVSLSNMVQLLIFDKKTKQEIRRAILKDSTNMFYTTSMQKNDFGKIISQNDIYFEVKNVIKVYGM